MPNILRFPIDKSAAQRLTYLAHNNQKALPRYEDITYEELYTNLQAAVRELRKAQVSFEERPTFLMAERVECFARIVDDMVD
jgi:long-subunit acyl-CoA synthetase (AMP-forming)